MSGRFAIDRRVTLYAMGGLVVAIGLFGLMAARSLGFAEALRARTPSKRSLKLSSLRGED